MTGNEEAGERVWDWPQNRYEAYHLHYRTTPWIYLSNLLITRAGDIILLAGDIDL